MAEYSLGDFVAAKYADAPEFADGMGIDIEKVRAIHEADDEFESDGSFGSEFVWFVHREGEYRFDMYLYEVNTWTEHNEVRSVDPFVLIHGTTFDGVRSCFFAATEPANLCLMATGLVAADAELRARGWAFD